MQEPISNPPEDLKEKLLTKKDKCIDTRSLNKDQELLAEIQVYRGKQKRWEESMLARMIRRIAIHFIAILSMIWFLIMIVALFRPSILPSIHPELSAINAVILVVGLLLGLFDTATLRSEKRSFDNLNIDHYQNKVEGDKKAQKLLNQLKQNQDMYQQEVEEELRESFSTLSMLMFAIIALLTSAMENYNFVKESYTLSFLAIVLILLASAAEFYCRRKGHPDDKPIDWGLYRALWRNEITLEEFEQRLNLSESQPEAEKMIGNRKERMVKPESEPEPKNGWRDQEKEKNIYKKL
ncbi:hypothetical protein CAEBREN_00125 [Caenorhabditis brenneri]|uniref:Uncharacterized protein n=1 Tax=Caenorhabditis brenneri TaxID=135651 RepID=G0NNF8_CAEBE|nr:hypothetical protein CAEBREN_00125 [Caenorhabditis brenneri]